MDFDMGKLKNMIDMVLDEERFDVKCFQTDRALTCMDYLRRQTFEAEDFSDLERAYEFSQQLYSAIYNRKDQILSYDAGDANPSNESSEQDLINLMIMTEIISYSVMAIGLKPDVIDNQQQELSDSVQKLTNKMNHLTLSPMFLDKNQIVSKFITTRGEGGLIMSMEDLLCQTVQNHQVLRQINQDQFAQIFGTIESILAKVVSLPVQSYNNLANNLVIKLVNNTGPKYHV